MTIYTMGFTKKSAADFFNIIKENKIDILIDIRLNNQSQLAGFTKGKDLEYFLKTICNCKYEHVISFAPTKEILNDYKKGNITWEEYVRQFLPLMEKRKIEETFKQKYLDYSRVLLLCSEPTPEYCHRRIVAEYLADKIDMEIVHL